MPTAVGMFRLRIYGGPGDNGPIAIIAGESFTPEPTAVRLHSACFISENLGCLGCDCRQHLDFAMQHIAAGGGVVVYLRREASGRGLADQIRKGACRFSGPSPLHRESFETAAMVLRDLGVRTVQLMTDDPGDADALAQHGISVAGRIPLGVADGPSIDLTGAFPQPALVHGQSLDGRTEGPELNVHAPSGHDD
ncbi:MAG TPA: hypothetical protein VNW97_13740 [Candidatus Saccharimonadales bacterium]|nr:hypothetical protein [Candidatus Saccharimonadales bacterium]